MTNATAGQMRQSIARLSAIAEAYEGEADLIFYYAGHGLPKEDTDEPYIIPVDVSSSNLDYALKLEDVFNKLTEHETERVTVFLDACFSGDSDAGPIGTGTSGPVLVVKNPVHLLTQQNGQVFTSTDNEYPACWYAEKKHSLFTYFFLRALQGEGDLNRDGSITVGELFTYVSDNTDGVPYYSKRLKGFEQKPCLYGRDHSKVLVKF